MLEKSRPQTPAGAGAGAAGPRARPHPQDFSILAPAPARARWKFYIRPPRPPAPAKNFWGPRGACGACGRLFFFAQFINRNLKKRKIFALRNHPSSRFSVSEIRFSDFWPRIRIPRALKLIFGFIYFFDISTFSERKLRLKFSDFSVERRRDGNLFRRAPVARDFCRSPRSTIFSFNYNFLSAMRTDKFREMILR